MRGPGPMSNEADVRDSQSHAMKTLFRGDYLMFASEIAHTTHWRELVLTVISKSRFYNTFDYFEIRDRLQIGR